MERVHWSAFVKGEPLLARHVEERLGRAPCYLATVRPDGWPRIHPIGVAIRDGSLVVLMYPTSPKGHDLRRNGTYALHGAVEDNTGGAGEVLITGTAVATETTQADIDRGWIAFELLVAEVLATSYDTAKQRPISTRWKARHAHQSDP